MWKKLISITFILLLANGYSYQKRKTISFAVGGAANEIQFWEDLTKEFEKQTGIGVNLLRQPTDTGQRRQGLLIALKSKKTDPDIFLLDVAWLAQFSASGWLLPLDEYIKEFNLNPQNFFQEILNSVDRHRGKIIALPVYVDGGLLYYRKDLLKKYRYNQPPRTWEKLVEMSLKIQKNERRSNPNFYAFLWQGAQYEGLVCNFIEFAGSGNGGIKIEGKKIKLFTSENLKALRFMTDLIQKYKISPPNTFTEMKEEEVRLFFQSGNALFERNWPYAWMLHQAEDSEVKGKIGIAPLPHFSGGKSISTLGGWHIGISVYSDLKSEAFQFLKFILSYPIQKKMVLKLGWNPGRVDLYQDKEILENLPHFEKLRDIFENFYPRPNLAYYTLISEVLQRRLNSAISGKVTPESALKSAEGEIQEIINRYER